MRVRMALMGCLGLLGAAALSAPAEAATPTQLREAKHEDGPYVNRILLINIAETPKNAYFRLKNTTNHNQDVLASDNSFGSGLADYEVRWFRGNAEITDEMQGIGSAFGLKPDHPKIVRARIKPLVADPGVFCLSTGFMIAPDAFETFGAFNVNDEACGG